MRKVVFALGLALICTVSLARAEDQPAGDKPAGKGAEFREKLLKKFDTNGDGKLDDTEKAAMKEAMQERFGKGGKGGFGGKGGAGREAFMKKFDTNGDGKLDDTEKAAMKEEFKKRREEFLKKYDTNGDGKLDDAEKAKAKEDIQKNRAAKGEKKA